MASESTEEGAVTLELPPGLDEWLDEQAATLGVPRETVVRQLLASYRTTAELDDDATVGGLLDVEAAVEDAMQDELDAAVSAAVADELDGRVDAAVADRVPKLTEAVEERLDDRIGSVEAEFQGKIEDVRERVVQVKRETDAKAPADHDHPEFDALEELEADLAELNRELVGVRDDVEDELADRESELEDLSERVDDVAARVDDAEDKLKRVAWVVSDLRDDVGGRDAHERAVDRIKRAAAQEGVSTASCESCGDSVDVSLLTDPECPHCGSTVSDVRPEGGILRKKARLVTAAQLESGAGDE